MHEKQHPTLIRPCDYYHYYSDQNPHWQRSQEFQDNGLLMFGQIFLKITS